MKKYKKRNGKIRLPSNKKGNTSSESDYDNDDNNIHSWDAYVKFLDENRDY